MGEFSPKEHMAFLREHREVAYKSLQQREEAMLLEEQVELGRMDVDYPLLGAIIELAMTKIVVDVEDEDHLDFAVMLASLLRLAFAGGMAQAGSMPR